MWTLWLHLCICAFVRPSVLVILLLSCHLVRPMWKRTLFFVAAQLSSVFYVQHFSSSFFFIAFCGPFLLSQGKSVCDNEVLFSWPLHIKMKHFYFFFYYFVRGISQMVFWFVAFCYHKKRRCHTEQQLRFFFSITRFKMVHISTMSYGHIGNKFNFVANFKRSWDWNDFIFQNYNVGYKTIFFYQITQNHTERIKLHSMVS